METTKINIVELITKDLNDITLELQEFLIDNGITPKSSNISELLTSIKELKVMYTNKRYFGLQFDENKYIIRVVPIRDFIARENIPDDISGGYYKLINGELVLDEQRKNQLEEV